MPTAGQIAAVGAGVATGGFTAIAGALLSVIPSLGPKETTGLPQHPVNDPIFAEALARKWVVFYLGHDPAQDAAGIDWWKKQIMQDGPVRAWANFSTSKEPVAKNVTGLADRYAAQYGNQYVVNAGTVGPSTSVVDSSTGYVTSQVDSVIQAAKLAGLNIQGAAAGAIAGAGAGAKAGYEGAISAQSQNVKMWLIVAGIVIVGFVLLRNK